MFFTFVYVNQNLSPALMDIRKMCCQLIETGFCHVKKKYAYTLQEFQDSKIKQLQEVQLYKNFSYICVYVYVYTDIVCFITLVIRLLLHYCFLSYYQAYSDLKGFHELVKEETVYTCGRYLMDAKARVGAYMMWILFKTHAGGHELIATVAI